MTDPEARKKVTDTIRREAMAAFADVGDEQQQQRIAAAFVKMSNRIIDRYLLHIFNETDQIRRAS